MPTKWFHGLFVESSCACTMNSLSWLLLRPSLMARYRHRAWISFIHPALVSARPKCKTRQKKVKLGRGYCVVRKSTDIDSVKLVFKFLPSCYSIASPFLTSSSSSPAAVTLLIYRSFANRLRFCFIPILNGLMRSTRFCVPCSASETIQPSPKCLNSTRKA